MNREQWPKITHIIIESLKSYPNGGLMILSSGISIANIISLFLTYFLEKKKSVIILLNFTNHELEYIDTQINYFATQNQLNNNKELALSIINLTKIPSEKRANFYKQGGIFAISTQIFMQDLLINTISSFIITHLIIQQAHTLKTKNDYECWITNFVKIQKPEIFLLALTNQSSILQLQQNTISLLQNLYLDNIILWPINRAEIVNCLKNNPLQWKEIKINISTKVNEIQDILIWLIDQCVKAVNGQCGTSFLTKDMVIQQSQHKLKALIQRQSFKIDLAQQQIFLDIFHLRRLLFALINQSAFQFYYTLTKLINEAPIDSIWYISQSEIEQKVEKLQKLVSSRVYQIVRSEKQINYSFTKKNGDQVAKALNSRIEFYVSVSTKYQELVKLLNQIQSQEQTQNQLNNKVWIWVQNYENVKQIQQYLISTYRIKDSSDYINQFNFLRMIQPTKTKNNIDLILNFEDDQGQNAKQKSKIVLKHNNKNLKQMKEIQHYEENLLNYLLNEELQQFYEHVLDQKEQLLLQQEPTNNTKLKQKDTYQILPKQLLSFDLQASGEKVNSDGIIIQFEEDNIIQNMTIVVNNLQDDCQRQTFKQNFKPDYIIIMEPNNSFLKELIINQCEAQTFLFIQNNCVESWQYYKEKLDEETAFERIVQDSGTFVKSMDKPQEAIKELQMQEQYQSSRIGKGQDFFQQIDTQPRILVDYREFRCDVPPKLYYNGFHITPVMLKVGDIVLSNNCAIERKSVETGDLIESLNQNRLENQIQRMNGFEFPFLLIEYSDNIPFALCSLTKSTINFSNNTKIMIRLLDLLIKYPKIQILWSNNSNDTIQIISKLKQTLGKNSPDIMLFKSNAQQNNLQQNEKITNYFTSIEKVII